MEQEEAIFTARRIMLEFAGQTGLTSPDSPACRYLWTDAHAVCNFLSLYCATEDEQFKQLAESLIEQVHTVLGRHRADDERSGWISGLDEQEGRNHPTAGGLRIGKKLNERRRDEAVNERLEWDRDGQYFHYLTKWMHALCRASAITGKQRYCRWAMELAKTAQAKFTANRSSRNDKRLFWKMSIDLSYPLVSSSGQHDALDAFITYNEISLCARQIFKSADRHSLSSEIEMADTLITGRGWHTDDPLGLGGLLFDAHRALQLTSAGQLQNPDLAIALLATSLDSLTDFAGHTQLSDPAEARLAFRELGLSIGLRAVARMQSIADNHADFGGGNLHQKLKQLSRYEVLGTATETFWSIPKNQLAKSWLHHQDINRVMLATSLLPDQFLSI